jgi:hypothetical protein
VEYATRLGARGNVAEARRATDTLHSATALLDPVWGGMYQYSVGGHWSEPHFEKLISIQAAALRAYSLAYAQTRNREDLSAALSVHRYVTNFLMSPATGAFFVSQDADLDDGQENESYFKLGDRERRALGIPRIDRHVYARENGWMIAALCDYYAASGDPSALAQARRAADWIAAHRGLGGGGFRHGGTDAAGPHLAGPYMGDTLAMGEGFLALYNVSGDRRYLSEAEAAGRFIAGHFGPTSPGTGFITSAKATDAAFPPHPDRDENIALMRFASLLEVATGNTRFHAMAKEAMRYLAAEAVALRPLSAGILLANQEMTEAPLHVTVVGTASSREALALHDAALRSIRSHELIELRDPSNPHALPTSITYPRLDRAALFLCTARACSSPVFDSEMVRGKIERAESQAAR